jgi:hypothetical protein
LIHDGIAGQRVAAAAVVLEAARDATDDGSRTSPHLRIRTSPSPLVVKRWR